MAATGESRLAAGGENPMAVDKRGTLVGTGEVDLATRHAHRAAPDTRQHTGVNRSGKVGGLDLTRLSWSR
jgi:hypothetical protein